MYSNINLEYAMNIIFNPYPSRDKVVDPEKVFKKRI